MSALTDDDSTTKALHKLKCDGRGLGSDIKYNMLVGFESGAATTVDKNIEPNLSSNLKALKLQGSSFTHITDIM